MKLASAADLSWQSGVRTTHALNLRLGIAASEVLVTNDPALELATRSAAIRAEIAAAFIGGHMPGLLASTGEDASVDGELETEAETQWKARTALKRAEGGAVSVEGTMDIVIRVETSRPVTAIQALAASRTAVAGDIAECVVGKLKRELLGIEATESHSTSRIEDGRIAAYRTREVGPGPIMN